jgi:protoporphyrinogen oxidase
LICGNANSSSPTLNDHIKHSTSMPAFVTTPTLTPWHFSRRTPVSNFQPYRSCRVCCSVAAEPLETPEKRSSTKRPDAIVVGAGVSGLSAARTLANAGLSVRIIESSDGVGGRVRSDIVNGFTLDRGFQVFIEAYPEQRALLGEVGYKQLNLQSFTPGALVCIADRFYTIADPFRAPLLSLQGLFAPVGSLADKLGVAALRVRLTMLPKWLEGDGELSVSTEEFLLRHFSPSMVDRFFRPFYSGIFLSSLDKQSARMFAFVFRMFALAPASLPSAGIGAFPQQLAAALPGELVSIELNMTVTSLSSLREEAPIVIIATDALAANRLLSPKLSLTPPPPPERGSTCVYFSSPNAAPVTGKILILNGDGEAAGPINNMCFPTNLSASLAPPGQTLVSATIVGDASEYPTDDDLEDAVRAQMSGMFGKKEVESWTFLRSYRVPNSQPAQDPSSIVDPSPDPTVEPGLYVCGDYRNTPTINGALASGRVAAEEAIAYFARLRA